MAFTWKQQALFIQNHKLLLQHQVLHFQTVNHLYKDWWKTSSKMLCSNPPFNTDYSALLFWRVSLLILKNPRMTDIGPLQPRTLNQKLNVSYLEGITISELLCEYCFHQTVGFSFNNMLCSLSFVLVTTQLFFKCIVSAHRGKRSFCP